MESVQEPAVDVGVHQFSRGMHGLCGVEIVAGIKGTRLRADVTCKDCLKVRDEIELGYSLFRMHPKAGDVVAIRLGPKETLTQELVNDSLVLTEKVRTAYPEVTFLFLWDEQSIADISDADMKQFGWFRGKPKKAASKKFQFKNRMTGR